MKLIYFTVDLPVARVNLQNGDACNVKNGVSKIYKSKAQASRVRPSKIQDAFRISFRSRYMSKAHARKCLQQNTALLYGQASKE